VKEEAIFSKDPNFRHSGEKFFTFFSRGSAISVIMVATFEGARLQSLQGPHSTINIHQGSMRNALMIKYLLTGKEEPDGTKASD
jgi:hypothetical protein